MRALSALRADGFCGTDRGKNQKARLMMAERSCTLYDVRPHACASIFHSSPCFENVYARVPFRV
ncbi:MAG: hypothetical protein WBL55_16620, partial [Xanthobacteraceae bacterium]